jgi:hypothetical protein
MRCNGAIRGEEALNVLSRLEPLHASFPLAGRLVGVFRTMVQMPDSPPCLQP